jgi:hypothetical protein
MRRSADATLRFFTRSPEWFENARLLLGGDAAGGPKPVSLD